MLAPRHHNHSTPQYVIEEAIKLLNPKKDEILSDLGCGDGRVLVYSAKIFGCRCIGYDIVEEKKLVFEENLKDLITVEYEFDNCNYFRCKNALDCDLSNSNCLFLFLTKHGLKTILPQINSQMKLPGSRIVTYLYSIPGIKINKTVWCVNPSNCDIKFPIFYYELPLENLEK